MDNAGSVAGSAGCQPARRSSAARTAARLVKIQPNLPRARLPASSPSLDAGQAGSLRSRRTRKNSERRLNSFFHLPPGLH